MSEQEHIPGHTTGSVERPARDVDPPVQVTDLGTLAAQVTAERARHDVDYRAYTLRHAAGLRQVLLAIRQDGLLRKHQVHGEVAIQVLSGEVVVAVQGAEHVLDAGALLNIAPSLPHELRGRQPESTILLTITRTKRGHTPYQGPPRLTVPLLVN
jgi:quercetin dioxygenase-like cupin family protein